MPYPMKAGTDCQTVRADEVRLGADVPVALKDALVDLALARRVPLKAVVTAALEAYVDAEVGVAA